MAKKTIAGFVLLLVVFDVLSQQSQPLATSPQLSSGTDGQQTQQERSYVLDWWENVYQTRIKSKQYEQIKTESLDQCSTKISWYSGKILERPNSIFYQQKIEKWNDRCK